MASDTANRHISTISTLSKGRCQKRLIVLSLRKRQLSKRVETEPFYLSFACTDSVRRPIVFLQLDSSNPLHVHLFTRLLGHWLVGHDTSGLSFVIHEQSWS